MVCVSKNVCRGEKLFNILKQKNHKMIENKPKISTEKQAIIHFSSVKNGNIEHKFSLLSSIILALSLYYQ